MGKRIDTHEIEIAQKNFPQHQEKAPSIIPDG